MKKRKVFILSLLLFCSLSLTSCDIKQLISSVINPETILPDGNIKELAFCYEYFNNIDYENSILETKGFANESIEKKAIVKDEESNILGYVYVVSGKNSYGPIILSVGISFDGKLVGVNLLENGQSFSKEVQEHVNNNYSSGLTLSDIELIDIKCGATFGAQTVKKLVKVAFDDLASE